MPRNGHAACPPASDGVESCLVWVRRRYLGVVYRGQGVSFRTTGHRYAVCSDLGGCLGVHSKWSLHCCLAWFGSWEVGKEVSKEGVSGGLAMLALGIQEP